MQQKRLDNILYVFQVEPYIITDDIEDVSYIYVEQDSLDGFQEINPELKLTGWNYSMYSVFEPPYAKYINSDDLVMEFENTSINVSTYVDEDYTGTVQDVSYTPEDASVTFTYFLGDTSLNSSTFTLDSSGSYTITAKLDPNEIYDEQEASYSLIYQKEKRQETLEFYSSPVVEISGEEGEIEILQVPTLTISPELPETIDWESYVQYTINDDPVISPDLSYEITVVEGVTDYVVKAILNNCPYIENTSTSMIYRVTGESSDYSKKYLTIEPLEAGTFSYTKGNSALSDISYSFDGNTWTQLAPNTNLNIVAEQNIMLKANQPTRTSSTDFGKLSYTGNYNVSGNIMSLLYGDNFRNQTSLIDKQFTFKSLFDGQSKLVNAENLVLPAQTLTGYCYNLMFRNCSSLITIPELPATTLSTFCYQAMYQFCTSLTTIPLNYLPATTLSNYCYNNMFAGCTNLTQAPNLPAQNLIVDCYEDMFNGCTSLTVTPTISATNTATYCFKQMFMNCTNLTTVGQISSATSAAQQSYESMFQNCSSLTTVPNNLLPATTLSQSCYNSMFKGCSSLTEAPELPATTLPGTGYQNMFNGCSILNYICSYNKQFNNMGNWTQNVAATGTFVLGYGDQNYWNTTGVVYGPNGIPTGWVVKDANGNTFTPKTALNLTWAGDPLTNTVFQNSQFTWNYAVTPSDITNITYSISQDGGTTWYNLGNQPGSINPDTSTIGTTNFKVKVEIANDPKYVDKTQIFNGSTTVVEAPDLDLSHYTRLDQIDTSLYNTAALDFNDVILDLSESLTTQTNVFITLKDTVTGQTSDAYNGIRTFSAIGSSDFNLRENRVAMKIQNAGVAVTGHSDFYAYKFSNLMRITGSQSSVRKDKIYFKIPRVLKATYSVSDTTTPVQILPYSVSGSSGSYRTTIYKSMKIDGVEQQTMQGEYLFTTQGDHVVEYTLTNNAEIPAYGLDFYNLPPTTPQQILSDVVIPYGVTTIKLHAFRNCDYLSTINIPDSVTTLGESIFKDSNIMNIIFDGNPNIEAIPKSMCNGCAQLSAIIIPDSVTSIATSAFNNCTGLTNVTIGSGVTSIAGGAFQNCTGLTSITIPDGVTSIGSGAFQGCTGLTSISVDTNNTIYDSRNNCNAIIETATNKLVKGCKNTVIPNTVTSIGDTAFSGCTGLTNVTIPNSVTSIDNSAFSGCSDLTSITIPSGVTSIDNFAFKGCTSLTSITVNAETPPAITGSGAFTNTNDCPIYVPANSVTAYQTANNWSTYASRIQAIP